MFKHLNHTQPNRRLQRPPPHPASPAANQLHCGWAATLELDRAAPQRPIPARIVATLELDRAAPQRPIPARIVATLELDRAAPQRPIPARIVATLELDRAAPQRPIPARIVATLGSAPWRTYSEPRPCTWPIRLRWCSRQSRSGSTTGRASASSGETATANPVCWACSPVNCGRTPVGSPGVADCG